MEEAMKSRLILILSVLCVILLISTIGSCSNAYRQKGARDKEMVARLDLEEKMSKFTQEKAAITDKLKAKDQELQEDKATLEATKKLLVQEQLVGQSLKDELTKVTKLKEALEGELREALTAAGKKQKK